MIPLFSKRAQKVTEVGRVFLREGKIIPFMKAIRIHQYVKNLLIFIPLLTGHLYTNFSAIGHACVAFVSFSLLASGVYLINDLVDLESDRSHHSKHQRPFAAGDLSIRFGVVTAVVLICLSLLIARYLEPVFLGILTSYFFLTTAYSFYLKKKLLLDVFILAMLYTVRIIAGIAVMQATYSEWLLIFSFFFFLSLAFLKRYIELFWSKQEKKKQVLGRSYSVDDLVQLQLFGTVSGYLSALVFAFYIYSNSVQSLHQYPRWLWVACILLLYWLSRIWMLASRGYVCEDPVLFALSDKTSVLVALLVILTMLFA